jgi:hypothetical protein
MLYSKASYYRKFGIGLHGRGCKVWDASTGPETGSERSPKPAANHRRMLYFHRNRAFGPVFPSATAVPLIAPVNLVGEWLSLVEHLVRDQGVGGSNPLSPTKFFSIFQGYQAGCPTLFAQFAKGWGFIDPGEIKTVEKADPQSPILRKRREGWGTRQ